jgi:hypothetical protein
MDILNFDDLFKQETEEGLRIHWNDGVFHSPIPVKDGGAPDFKEGWLEALGKWVYDFVTNTTPAEYALRLQVISSRELSQEAIIDIAMQAVVYANEHSLWQK